MVTESHLKRDFLHIVLRSKLKTKPDDAVYRRGFPYILGGLPFIIFPPGSVEELCVMNADYIKMLLAANDRSAILDNLAQTSFDELVEYNLNDGTYKTLYHFDGKYAPVEPRGSLRTLYRLAWDYLVYPGDRDTLRDMLDPDTIAERLQKSSPPGILMGEMRCRTLEGGWRWTQHVLVCGAQYGLPADIMQQYIYDISHEKEEEEDSVPILAHNAQRDELTGLMTERAFFAAAQKKLRQLRGEWCLIAIDIEHFKLFQDWNGQAAGDQLLASYGEALNRAAAAVGGLAGYRGQDDFCLMVPFDRPRIDALYEELRQAIAKRNNSVGFSPIFGICKIDGSDAQIGELFNRAALAAEELKGDFRKRIQLYSTEIHQKQANEFRLLSDFQRSLESGEICFFLQPQCRVSTGRVVGAESLARWRRPDGSWISPAVFVPILEKHGIITNLDQFIWEAVCRWLRGMFDKGIQPVPVSVNLSPLDIFTIDVPAFLCGLMEKYHLPHEYLKIEITESAYAKDTAAVRRTMQKLRELGFLVLMDDFGSGYSSLNMLRTLNVDVIKLDAQFLHISSNEERKGVSILESIINMTKTLGAPIIVEGVETRAQVNFLRDLGCRYMQGYYFYRPMPPEAFEGLIRDGNHSDHSGFVFKANQEMHIREFMDSSIYSDAMLNNVLGPVCFYSWRGDDIDILRYNQQFYMMLNMQVEEVNRRLHHIQNYFYPADLPGFYQMLSAAMEDRINGAWGVFRVFKPNDTLVWLSVRVYYMDEDANGKKFYASCQDITELQYVNHDLPGAYYRCAADDTFEFLYISDNFLQLVDYTREEIRDQFDNRLTGLMHPDDVPGLIREAKAFASGKSSEFSPYRLRRKDGEYIYVVEMSRLTDRFGGLTWQCVCIEVTELMRLRNQMRLLGEYFSGSIVFVHDLGGQVKYEVAVHGLDKKLGMDTAAFTQALNDGSFLRCFDLPPERKNRQLYWINKDNPSVMNDTPVVRLPGREPFRLRCRFDGIKDKTSDVICIIMFSSVD